MSRYRIKREIIEGGQEMFDVYVFVEGVWQIVDSFQYRENAEKYVENCKREEMK